MADMPVPPAPGAPEPATPLLPDTFTLSSSPHVRRRISIASIMRDVLLALLPAVLVGLYYFGWHVLGVIGLCVGAACGFEALFQRMMGQKITVRDGSAAVTGLLLAMTLPPRAEWWLCILGSLVAIGLGKQVFGGLGYNPFNPALLGRVVLLISFPAQMSVFYTPTPFGVDAMTTATPLALYHEARIRGMDVEKLDFSWSSAFLGEMPGSLGETSALALIAGGLFLLWRRHITWDIPVTMLGSIAVVSAISAWLAPDRYLPLQFHLLTGGVMLAAIYMATDMVTSPLTTRGKLIFGTGCGLLTIIIRQWGGYPEAVSFAILLMNATVPFIDRYTAPRLYGTGRPPQRGPVR